MPLLTEQDTEAELSYAYLHAVAARIGAECAMTGRHSDGAGVDATLRMRHDFGPEQIFKTFTVDVQLKATKQTLTLNDGLYSYSLSRKGYDDLRDAAHNPPRFLFLMLLPENAKEWLVHSEEGLISKRCVYWLGLRDAPDMDEGRKSRTVYVPKRNVLSPATLMDLLGGVSRGEVVTYTDPHQ